MTDETIYHVTFENSDREEYVLAETEKQVHVVLKRMFRAPRYDFDWTEYDVRDTGSTDIERMARGSEPPFSVLEAHTYHITEHEKRVNQAGYKGMYLRRWNR